MNLEEIAAEVKRQQDEADEAGIPRPPRECAGCGMLAALFPTESAFRIHEQACEMETL